MNTHTGNKTGLAGWLIAAVLAGIMLGSGFQDGKEKFGVVDLRKVILDSKISKETSDKVINAEKARVAVLTFIRDNRVITDEQASRMRVLELQEAPKTEAEQAELTKIKTDVLAACKEKSDLDTNNNPTEPERLRLMALSRTEQNSAQILVQYQEDFRDELQKMSQDVQLEAFDKATKAATAIAKSKGFTIIFSSSAVAYAANDLTADATKEANK